MGGGDALAVDERDQGFGVALYAWGGDDEGGAVEQGPEEFPDGDVEAEGGLLQDTIGGVECVGALHPVEAIDERAMLVLGALGLAGGA